MPQSVISGATTVRRAQSVAEMLAHGGAPEHLHRGEGHGPKSIHFILVSLAQSHHQGPPHPHQMHHRVVLGNICNIYLFDFIFKDFVYHIFVILGENGPPSKLPTRQRNFF